MRFLFLSSQKQQNLILKRFSITFVCDGVGMKCFKNASLVLIKNLVFAASEVVSPMVRAQHTTNTIRGGVYVYYPGLSQFPSH